MENVFELSLQCSALYGYTFLRSGVPLVQSLALYAGEEAPEEEGEVELSFEPAIFSPWKKKLGRLRRGERILVPVLEEGLAEVLLGNHGGGVDVNCVLRGESGVLAQTKQRVPLCDINEFCGRDSYLSLIASFVTPDALAVGRLAEQLPQQRSGGSGRYAKAEIRLWVEEAYALLRHQEITYAMHGFSAEKKGQHLRFPAQCLKEKTANAMELALVFASLGEAAGLDPLVILTSSCVLVGVYSADHFAVSSEIFDPALLLKQCKNGDLTVLDPSCLCYGTDFPFSVSEKNAITALEQTLEFLGAVDVAKAREQGVRGIPSELYERVSEEYARRLIPMEEAAQEETPAEREKKALLRSARVKQLLCGELIPVAVSAQEAEGELRVESEALSQQTRACLAVGRIEYADPLYSRPICAAAVLYPLARGEDGVFRKTDGAILNTPLLERLGVLYGLFPATVEESFARGGREGALRVMEEYFSDKVGVSFSSDSCFLWEADPYPALSFDALRQFSLSSSEEEPQWKKGPSLQGDKEALHALQTAQNARLSLILSPESSLREDVVTELVARAMAVGREVSLVSGHGERVRQRLEQWAQREEGEPAREESGSEYFDQVFFVHPHGYSFYHAHLLWDQYSDAPEAARIPSVLLEGKTQRDVVEWSRAVSELTDAWEKAGGVPDNPLQYVENPFYSEDYKAEAMGETQEAERALSEYLKRLEGLWELFSLEGEITLASAQRMSELLSRLQEAKEVPYYYYERRNDQLVALVETGRKHEGMRSRLEERFLPSVFRLDAEALHCDSAGERGGFRLLRKSPRKAAVQALRSCARAGIVVNDSNAEEILEQLIRCKEYEAYLSEHAEELKAGFGVDIQSPDGDPKDVWLRLGEQCDKGEAVLEAYRRMDGAEEAKLSKLCKSEELYSRLEGEAHGLSAAASAWEKAEEILARRMSLRKDKALSLPSSLQVLRSMRESMDSLREWTLWLQARAAVRNLGLAGVVEQCESGRFTAEELKLNFLCGLFRSVAEQIRSHSPALASFDPEKEREEMKRLLTKREDVFASLCREALEKGSLCCVGLREAARVVRKKKPSLLILDGAEKLSAKEGGGLLAWADQTVVVASPRKECEGAALAQLASELGAEKAVIGTSYGEEDLFSCLGAGLSADAGIQGAASVYPVMSEDCKAELLRVNGGYDEPTGTNVIEASVIVDELLEILERGEESATVVCFGQAQRKLVTLLLAKRLAALPRAAKRYLADPERYVVCALGEEAPKADCVFVSLCFSCPHGKYGEGLSAKLFEALGENVLSRLVKLFSLPKKRLCFTAAFTMEEVAHTRCAAESMRIFSLFARRIFSLTRLQSDQREERPLCDGIVGKIALALGQKGYRCRRNAGFSSVGVPLLVEDPREGGKTAVAVIADETLHALCSHSDMAEAYLEGFARRGVKVFRLSSLAWYCDKERVIRELVACVEESAGDAAALIPEMPSLKAE